MTRSTMSRSCLASVLLFLFLPACGSDEGVGSRSGEERILEPDIEEIFRAGRLEGDSWDSFSRINSMAFDGEGRLHILDSGTRRVHVVDSDGSHRLSFGRSGEGPGEFRGPTAIVVLDDGRIVVSDSGHQAFLLFSAEGEFLGSHRMGDSGALPGSRIQRQGATALVSEARGFRLESRPGGGPPVLPSATPIQRWDLADRPAGGDEEILVEAWRPERADPSTRGGGGGPMVMMAARALEPQVHLAVLPDGRLAISDSSSYRIRVYGPDGETAGEEPTFIGRDDIRPRPVGPAEERAERERRLDELATGGGPQIQITTSGPGGAPQMMPQDQIRGMLEEQIETMEFWHEIPVITRLAADPEGRLWVERSAGIGEEGPIDILESDGALVGTIPAGGIRTPLAFGPDGLVAWVEFDELEVPSVRVARLRVE